MYTIANVRPIGHNVGNHAIHFALKNMLFETFGRLVSVIEIPATSVYESSGRAGLTPQTVHQINRFADGVIVGGGNLFENNEIAIDPQALSSLQPPLMLFSNSRGKIYDRYGRLAERTDVISDSKLEMLVKRADISLSRDSVTHDHLVKLNLEDELGWCPTINTARYSAMIPQLPKAEDTGALISVRTPDLMNLPSRFQTRVARNIELLIDELRGVGFKRVRLLCNDSRDLDFSSLFRFTKSVESVYTNDVYLYLALLKTADIVVSFRLHATLPAISFGTKTINVVYDQRARCLFNDLGLNESYLDMVELGDDFEQSLVDTVRESKHIPRHDVTTVGDWESKRKVQMERFVRFRGLVDEYLSQGRLARSQV